MDNEQWLQWRRGGIGSSDAAIIMGVSPWRTPNQLWHDKVYGNSVQFETSSMTRGKEMEPVARSWFEQTMGVAVFPKNKTHPEQSFIRASLDGIDVDDKVMVEIKCPNRDDHATALLKQIPEKYIPQLQHQLLVTGLDGMYYCSFDGANGAIVEVARDNAYIEAMLQEEQKFWDMVLKKEAPQLTERDFVELDDTFFLMASTCWKNASLQLKELEKEEDHWRQELIKHTANRNSQGNGVKISKSMCSGAIDYKQVIADHPHINWEAYRKAPFAKWTFRATA